MIGKGGREGLTQGVKASTLISIAPASCSHPAGLAQRRPCLCTCESALLIMLCFGAPMHAEGQWIRGVVINLMTSSLYQSCPLPCLRLVDWPPGTRHYLCKHEGASPNTNAKAQSQQDSYLSLQSRDQLRNVRQLASLTCTPWVGWTRQKIGRVSCRSSTLASTHLHPGADGDQCGLPCPSTLELH